MDSSEDTPEIPVTHDGRRFRIDREDVLAALDSGAGYVRFTAPEGFRFTRDEHGTLLVPDPPHDDEGNLQ